jgi:hypothetical protein
MSILASGPAFCIFTSSTGVTHATQCSCDEKELVTVLDGAVNALVEFRNRSTHTRFNLQWEDMDTPVTAINDLLRKLVSQSAARNGPASSSQLKCKRKREDALPCPCGYERCWVAGNEATFICGTCDKAWHASHAICNDDGKRRCAACSDLYERTHGKRGVCEGCEH